jgi:acyl-homoserine lactone synthase
MRVHVVNSANRDMYLDEIEAMHRHRYKMFVDIKGWKALESPDRLDIDEFDSQHTTYLLTLDDEGELRGCDRLIPTWRPHMLKNLFPEYVNGPVPTGPTIWEWSRHAPGHPSFGKEINFGASLVSGIALLEFARTRGIEMFTGILEYGYMKKALQGGWKPQPLGEPINYGEGTAVAVAIPADYSLIDQMRAVGGRSDPILIELPSRVNARAGTDARKAIELAMRLPENAIEPATRAMRSLF